MVLYLVVRKRLERREGGFSLGRFELPVAVAALIWVVARAVRARDTAGALVPVLIVVGLILAGGVYFAKMLVLQPRGARPRNVRRRSRPATLTYCLRPRTADITTPTALQQRR